jgi:hypothetical protein
LPPPLLVPVDELVDNVAVVDVDADAPAPPLGSSLDDEQATGAANAATTAAIPKSLRSIIAEILKHRPAR